MAGQLCEGEGVAMTFTDRTPAGARRLAIESERKMLRTEVLTVVRDVAERMRHLAESGDEASIAELKAMTALEVTLYRLATRRSSL